jgi:hypothetical protein
MPKYTAIAIQSNEVNDPPACPRIANDPMKAPFL